MSWLECSTGCQDFVGFTDFKRIPTIFDVIQTLSPNISSRHLSNSQNILGSPYGIVVIVCYCPVNPPGATVPFKSLTPTLRLAPSFIFCKLGSTTLGSTIEGSPYRSLYWIIMVVSNAQNIFWSTSISTICCCGWSTYRWSFANHWKVKVSRLSKRYFKSNRMQIRALR